MRWSAPLLPGPRPARGAGRAERGNDRARTSSQRPPRIARLKRFTSKLLFLLFGEHVAHAADGEDALRVLGIGLDRGADASHVNVDRAVEGFELAPAHG